ncbi:MAG TPA: LON peptidase substrate-binding domain-containing protein, partial [Nitrospira sp.]|nr:LON peptidase substrate-binding domain-containing protein [Nitrospira sp.]
MQTDRERDHHEPESSDKSAPFPIPTQIPVFALPNVVLFPRTYLPLHIFEPRYRQMVDDTVMGGQCIGI